MFIAEACQGAGGVHTMPEGFIQKANDHVRKAGGIYVADEVQIGFARCGTHFWGFEKLGAKPDIVVMGKTIGNASIFREYMNLETGELKLEEMVVGVQLKKGPLINLKRNRQVPAPIPKTSTGLN